ncbi:GerAB/ArcD/ProY family transporter [Neobacillus sp. Marseille-QA0830]
MENAKISAYQMFALVILFEMGSAVLFAPGIGAKQDAWIAVMLGLAGGLLVFMIYYQLFKLYPGLPLTSYVQKITGKWLGRFIGSLYCLYFLYMATRILRDFGDLLVTTIYTDTPLLVINTLLIVTIIYGIHKGFEVIARIGEFYLIVIYVMAILGMVLILISKLIHLENIKPILENGWNPVFWAFLSQTITFPFGEMVVFTTFFPFLNDPKKITKACMGGMLLAGINIVIITVINISVLGATFMSRSNFPLLTTISKIQLADFIERLEVFFMLYLVIAAFFKITLFFYAAVLGAADIFKITDPRRLSFPLGFIALMFSMTISANYAEQIKEGEKIIPFFLHWPFQIMIPVLLLLVAFIRKAISKTSRTVA